MDGFLRAPSDEFSIGYYERGRPPFTPACRPRRSLRFDRFFCSLLSSTYPNREYMHAGQSYGRSDNSLPVARERLGFPDTTIFNALSRPASPTGTSTPTSPSRPCGARPGCRGRSQVQTYYEQAAAGRHRALSFVDPSFQGEDQGTSRRRASARRRPRRPGVHRRRGARLHGSPQWKRGALFIVYDEWGGFFDHVAPPRVPDLRADPRPQPGFRPDGLPDPAVARLAVRAPRSRRPLGLRVRSILNMIRYRYGRPPLTPRDLYANNIATAFDFESNRTTTSRTCRRRRSHRPACPGSPPVSTGGAGLDDGPLGSPPAAGRHAQRAQATASRRW